MNFRNDESDEASDDAESETNSVKVKLFEKKKKKKADEDQSDSDEVAVTGGEQPGKNPSKKARLIEGVPLSVKKVTSFKDSITCFIFERSIKLNMKNAYVRLKSRRRQKRTRWTWK